MDFTPFVCSEQKKHGRIAVFYIENMNKIYSLFFTRIQPLYMTGAWVPFGSFHVIWYQ